MKRFTLILSLFMAVCFGVNAQVLKISDAPVDGNWATNTTWYLIQNFKGGYVSTDAAYCDTDSKLRLSNTSAPADDNENALWCIVGDEEFGYKFYNKANGTSKVLLASRTQDSASASFNMADATGAEGEYFNITKSQKNGYVIVYDHNNANEDGTQNNYWNYRDGNLAYWFATTGQVADDGGSAFAFLNVDEYETAVSECEGIIETTGVQYSTTPIVTKDNAATMMYSNAYCTDTRWGDAFSSWDVLFDNNPNTFFHSEYASGKTSTDGLEHYLRVDMGEGKTVSEFIFTYTTRNYMDGYNHPKEMIVEGSNEENGVYTEIEHYTALKSAAAWTFTSETLTCSEPYRYIRFRVITTHQGSEDSEGKQFFFMGEFGMTTPPVVSVNAEYAAYKTELVQLFQIVQTTKTATSVKDRAVVLYNLNNALDVVDRTLNPEFYALQDKIAELSTIVACGGEEVGHYANVEPIATAVAAAQEVLDNESSTVNDYTTSLETLNALNPQINLPEEGKFYNIVSACTVDHRGGQMIYVNEDGAMQFARNDVNGLELAKGSLGQVIQFIPAGEGLFYIYFVARGTYLSTAKAHSEGQAQALAQGTDGAVKVAFTNLGKENIVKIVPVGGAMLHTQDSGSKIVAWNNEDYDNGSAWKISEVADPATTSFDLTVGEAGYATLCLGCATTVPAGIEAYVVSEIKDGYVDMTIVEGAIPAGEAVILKKAEGQPAEATTYSFKFTASANEVESNLLEGTTINTNITPEGTAYVLGNVENNVGLYKATLNQAENTAFKNNANKAYLVVPASEGAEGIASYSFRFGEETTGIDEVKGENGNVKVIYDLTGRRVENPSNGIYIINGVKTLVK